MAKPLSQEEIDVLLNAGDQPGGADARAPLARPSGAVLAEEDERVQPYNFKRPRLFSQDQMRILHYVHESFARDLSVYLSAQLRTIVDIGLSAVDQVLYSEFVMSSAPPSALYVQEAQGLGQKMVLEIDPRLIIYTIEKLFGGAGVFLDAPREVSQIEQRIMSKVMERALDELESAWEQAHDLKLREVAFESNAEFVQIIPAVEPAIVAAFDVTIYDQRSYINICYPYLLLEKMLGRAGMKQWISSSTAPAPARDRARYEETLRATSVELSAELGRARLPVADLLGLQEGDVVPLARGVKEPVEVYVNGRPKFKAAAGRSGKKRALRITAVAPMPAPDASGPEAPNGTASQAPPSPPPSHALSPSHADE